MKKLLSLLLGACTIFTACSDDNDNLIVDGKAKLSVNVGLNQTGSRALITEATLPDGEEGAIGVMLTDGDATLTDYDAYTNVKFTGTTGTDGVQGWTGATDILLTENTGTVYACFPYNANTDFTMSAIAIETTSQTDYLYATPVEDICETSSAADLTMNHALTNIKLTFANAGYEGDNTVSDVSVSGQGIATAAVFNAAQTTPAYVAGSFTGVGDAITSDATTTLGGTAIDIMVISNNANEPITIAAKIGGVDYSVTTKAIALAKGNSYNYTLKVKSTYMAVSNVEVTPWNQLIMDEELNMEKEEIKLTWETVTNGVYAISSKGEPVLATNADKSCIAIALVSGEHKFMIAKNDALSYDGSYILYYTYNSVNLSLTDYYNVDGTNGSGYLGGTNTPQLSNDFNTWNAGALSDFNGENNTKIIAESSTNQWDMCKALESFNNGTNIYSNEGASDWYVPALGQLALIWLNKTEINELLETIGGDALIASSCYFSSTENGTGKAWMLHMNSGSIQSTYKNGNNNRVRFIRNLNFEGFTENKNLINSADKTNGVYVITAAGELVDYTTIDDTAIGVALITDNQRIMIEKYGEGEQNKDIIKAAYDTDGATNTDYKYFSWGNKEENLSNITDCAYESDAKTDFNGKKNSRAISSRVNNDDKNDYANMGTYCKLFNETHTSFRDWYIPAAGQLSEIYSNVTDINTALTNIGGTTLYTSGLYWSSSENDTKYAWYISFSDGGFGNTVKYSSSYVRFIRDIK